MYRKQLLYHWLLAEIDKESIVAFAEKLNLRTAVTCSKILRKLLQKTI